MARHIAWRVLVGGVESFHYTEEAAFRELRAQACWVNDGTELAIHHRPAKDSEWELHETLVKRGIGLYAA